MMCYVSRALQLLLTKGNTQQRQSARCFRRQNVSVSIRWKFRYLRSSLKKTACSISIPNNIITPQETNRGQSSGGKVTPPPAAPWRHLLGRFDGLAGRHHHDNAVGNDGRHDDEREQ